MGLGLLWCAVAGVGFGVNFLPVKKVDVGDGVFFSFCMSIGIMSVGLFASFAGATQESLAFKTMPAFEPYAMLGGASWMLGTLMCPTIIKRVGLGVGQTVWSLANMIVGWASGYFGLLHVPKEHMRNETLNLAGISLVVASLALFAQARDIQPKFEESVNLEAKPEEPNDLEADQNTSPNSGRNAAPQYQVLERMGERMKGMLGFAMALAAGCMMGYTFDPSTDLAHRSGHSGDQMDYVWSNFAGTLLMAIVALVVYVTVRGRKSFVRKVVVLPGIASGAVWGCAQVACFEANQELSLSIVMPIVSSLPTLISLFLGACFFGELKTKRGRIFAVLGIMVRTPGVVLIALSR
jgi:glucose uptake protein GlcU